MAKANLIKKKKGNAVAISKHDFKLYYRAIVTKPAWYWKKKKMYRAVEQNRKPRVAFCGYTAIAI
jgi:hypothetical protein